MKQVQQKRALATREKILSALEMLLAEMEFEAISIADIARTAGVAVGSVYSHFKDKSALLPCLLDRRAQDLRARISDFKEHGVVAGYQVGKETAPTLRCSIELALRAALDQVTQSRGMARAILTYRRLNPELETPVIESLAQEAFEIFVRTLGDYGDEIRRDNLRDAAKMVNHFVNVIFLDQAIFIKPPFPEALTPDNEARIAAYTHMLHAYLTDG